MSLTYASFGCNENKTAPPPKNGSQYELICFRIGVLGHLSVDAYHQPILQQGLQGKIFRIGVYSFFPCILLLEIS